MVVLSLRRSSVPPFRAILVPVAGPSPVAVTSRNVPALMAAVPDSVLLVPRIIVPAPNLVRPAMPVTVPLWVRVWPLATYTNASLLPKAKLVVLVGLLALTMTPPPLKVMELPMRLPLARKA